MLKTSKVILEIKKVIEMKIKAILLIMIMITMGAAPMLANNVLVDEDSYSSKGSKSLSIAYYGSWTGNNALINHTQITPITAMSIPLTANVNDWGISNNQITSNNPSSNWWMLNTPSLDDSGSQATNGNAGTLQLNGNANIVSQGKIYNGIELGGNTGDNITSTNCASFTPSYSNSGHGFAGWFKPVSLDGNLFSKTIERSTGAIDGINVKLNGAGFLEIDYYWESQNETDIAHNNTFNATYGMSTPVEINEWNYISVMHYNSYYTLYTSVHVNNGTTLDTSSTYSQSYSNWIGRQNTYYMQTWGPGSCVFGEEFEGKVDELRVQSDINFFSSSRALGQWQTDGPKALPPGLSFNYSSGTVSGTPLTPWDATSYDVYAQSGQSSATTTLTIQVREPDLPSITHGLNDNYYLTVGDNESIQAPPNIGGDDAFWTLTSGHPNYTGEVDISQSTTCALDDEGKLYCWGKNEQARVLDTSFGQNYFVQNPTLHPDAAAANLTFTKIAAETNGLCGILTNGTLWCWGNDGGNGYLGHGNYNGLQAPTQVLFDPELNSYANTGTTLGTYNTQGCNDINPASGFGFESFENTSAVAWEEHLVEPNGNPSTSDGNWSYTNTSVHSSLNTLHGDYVLGSASSNLGSVDSESSYTIVHNEDSIVTMNITTGAGMLSFCYMWSTYYSYDYMYVYLDGVQIHVESNYYNTNYWDDWRSLNRYVTAGDHTLTIKFHHDSATYNGFDRVFIDALKWPLPTPPVNWTEPTVTDFAWYIDSACAVADSDVYCWGENGNGQLGNGDTTDRLRPTKVSTPTGLNFTAVDVGNHHACALADDASMWCWGYNNNYQLGNTNNTQSTTPVEVDFGAHNVSVSSIEVGQLNTCAIGTDDDTSNEQLWCWGYNGNQHTQVGNSASQFASDGLVYDSPSTGSIPIHVETDTYQTCTLFSDSTVQCIGKKFLTDGSLSPAEFGEWEMDEFSHVTSLSSGGSSAHGMCVMVQNNKALFCWGNNAKHNLARGYVSAYGAPDAVYGLIAGRDNAVLAPGLTFNNSNGVISGTPIVEDTTLVELNIYACNGKGCDSTPFNYSIWDRPTLGQIQIESEYLSTNQQTGLPNIYKGRPVNLSIEVTTDRTISIHSWYSDHINGQQYSNYYYPGMWANSDSITTTQLPVGLQVIYYTATDDIGGISSSIDGWVVVEVLESDDDNDQVPYWNDDCPGEDASGYDIFVGDGSENTGSDGCIDNQDIDQFDDPDDSCPTEHADISWDVYIGMGTTQPGSDGCIDDTDKDTIGENIDLCLNTPIDETIHVNSFGCGPSERDTDGDGYKDNVDNCENTPLGESVDEYGCGESQVDTDGDGVYDLQDVCPESPPGLTVDIDGCAAEEKDSDNDGVNDQIDICDTTPLGSVVNLVGCADGDVVTDDVDQDGIADIFDECPQTPIGDIVDYDGCGLTQKDSDSDGLTDNIDECINTPEFDVMTVNSVGCGSSERDSDNDGISDAIDQCLNTPEGVEIDTLGCQSGLADSDNDGVYNLLDACPSTSTEWPVNLNGCAEYQLDTDGDGITDDLDNCPTTPAGQIINEVTGCAVDAGVFDPDKDDTDGDGISNEFDECPSTVMEVGKIINNRGCTVDDDNESNSISTSSLFGVISISFLLIILLLVATVIVTRKRGMTTSEWDSLGEVITDMIDKDGDGVISDEEWTEYQMLKKESEHDMSSDDDEDGTFDDDDEDGIFE